MQSSSLSPHFGGVISNSIEASFVTGMTIEGRISGHGEEILRSGNSFTALLELPPPQAMELLHSPVLDLSPEGLPEVKNEPTESISNLNSPSLLIGAPTAQKKRKERDNNSNKVKGGGRRKSKNMNSEDGETGPHVHVRARRGQATDSHSLAERARREKINTRMKLLQELVPGCDKISGTALILDEIINHVQSLQRQVEFLSMRLAQVDPNTAFNLDGLLAAAEGSFLDSNYTSRMLMPLVWREAPYHGNVQYQSNGQCDAYQQAVYFREEEKQRNFITPENSILS